MIKKVLTIAGSDCSGGAGIQADLKTMTMYKVFGMSVITAITAQNTLGIAAIHPVPCDIIAAQLDAVWSDLPPDAVKIGMIPDAPSIRVLVDKLKKYRARNIILDPVGASTSGTKLIGDGAYEILTEELMPLATLITPNLSEAEKISGIKIASIDEMIFAGRAIRQKIGTDILIKGGHLEKSKTDILFTEKGEILFEGENIPNPNTHGTGCTLSSAIACGLALGKNIADAVRDAKRYVALAIRDGLDLGGGCGPLNHMHAME
ncbi:MAG: bifunctional hydroxymethylpyrimidine kinase/phosphomethylpyrimidine kinase [Peptostreptococcaceae bacterium]|nr:bifunctional hydroxymethylpyrimidine kinase/phosphomethylpyrimidine kinase [Peptostreptococcaceae bacterium]